MHAHITINNYESKLIKKSNNNDIKLIRLSMNCKSIDDDGCVDGRASQQEIVTINGYTDRGLDGDHTV